MANKKPLLLVKAESFVQGLENELGYKIKTTNKTPPPIKFEDAIKKQVKQVVVAEKPKKKVKGPVIKKKVKKVKKKKVVDTTPLRPSPFKLGDKVWVQIGDKWILGEIILTRPPVRATGEIVWKYKISNTDDEFEENALITDKIFTLNASDAAYMKETEFTDALNKTFDEKVFILAVYRKGQKRPWAYYVIPNKSLIWKQQKYEYKAWVGSNAQEVEGTIYAKPVEQMTLRLIPISGAPQEILTYLGLHVYNRKWVKIHGAHSTAAEALDGAGSTES